MQKELCRVPIYIKNEQKQHVDMGVVISKMRMFFGRQPTPTRRKDARHERAV